MPLPPVNLDYPRIRRNSACPICSGAKGNGLVWCWPCHNEIQGGDANYRAIAEDKLVQAEAVLEHYQEFA